MKTKGVCLTIMVCLCLVACSSGPQKKKAAGIDTGFVTPADNGTMQRLLPDYTGMKEDDTVSWAWIDSAFKLNDCGAVSVEPVLNYSTIDYPVAQQRIKESLENAFAGKTGGSSHTKGILVTAAITGMHGKPSFIKRFSPSYEDTPSVELEIVIVDDSSKRDLVKICHMARAEDIPQALDKLMRDVATFLDKKI